MRANYVKNLTMASIRTAIDLKLFNHLSNGDGAETIAKLQELTGAESDLLGSKDPICELYST